MRKILAILLALTMIVGLGAVAFADGTDGTITVSNTTAGQTYTLYKVFDATYDGDKVAYTYNGSNATFLAALQAETSPFTVTQIGSTGVYTVERKATVTDDTVIIDFIKANGPTYADNAWSGGNLGNAVDSKTGTGAEITFENLAYGYYFITSTLGSLVTIDSALKDVTVVDKNQDITPPDKTEAVSPATEYSSETSGSVGDKVNYKVTGTIVRYKGEELITSMTFTDTMTEGLTPNKDVVVTVKEGETTKTLVAGTDYDITYDGQSFTLVLTCATVDDITNETTFKFASGAEYTITYSAVINEKAIVEGEEQNTISLKYNDNKDVGEDTTKVKTYNITLTKEDKATAAKLATAKFKLYDAETGGNEIPVVLVTSNNDPEGYGTETSTVNNVYRHAKSGETSVEMVTGTTGIIEIKGLKAGTYWLEETEAPKGYNKLTSRKEITIAEAGSEDSYEAVEAYDSSISEYYALEGESYVLLSGISDADTFATTLEQYETIYKKVTNSTGGNIEITVENVSGSELPSTGGIGTTIFYIVGGLLAVGAGVVLVTKKRMSKEDV